MNTNVRSGPRMQQNLVLQLLLPVDLRVHTTQPFELGNLYSIKHHENAID
jgi:hypothetical protein